MKQGRRKRIRTAGIVALTACMLCLTSCENIGYRDIDPKEESTVSAEPETKETSLAEAEITEQVEEKPEAAVITPVPAEAYPSIRDREAAHCLEALDDNECSISRVTSDDVYGDTKRLFDIQTLGEWTLPEDLRQELEQMLVSVYAPGYTMGFLMMDIRSGNGVCFNSDAVYYSASSSKASFVVSLIREHPEVLEKKWSALSQVTVDSNNDQYFVLEYDYGQQIHLDYAKSVGVDLQLDEGGFADVSAEDLARLWLANYDFFSSSADGEAAGELFESQAYSAIKAVFMDTCMTRSKSGWIAGMLHNSSIDAGIVYAEGHPYVLVIMSDFPDSLEDLYDTARLLDRVHEKSIPAADPS